MLKGMIDENEVLEHGKVGPLLIVKNPRQRKTKEQKAKSMLRRSTITAALGGLDLDDSILFGEGTDEYFTSSER